MYFIVLKYKVFLGAYPLLEQNFRIRNGNTYLLIFSWLLRGF